jgi:acyl-coenzyme A synthetase/AMP-(fatty) acid ligase
MQPSKPLSRLLIDPPPVERAVAFRRNGEISAGALLRDVSALVARLRAIGPGRFLLITDDSYAAAVGLLALAGSGSVGVLPPNRQSETLRELAANAVGVLRDAGGATEGGALASLPAIELLAGTGPGPAAVVELDRNAPLIEFRTSGTTGEGRPVVKALRHLEDEVVALEARFGAALPRDAKIFATASHQHIYGLLFRVLWPLASGRPFQVETLLHQQELLPRIAAAECAGLVTTPVHLKRMAASEGLGLLRGICAAVYSSGGPLAVETAESVASQLGAAPYEIFGSTETGGVATRRRDIDGEVWQPLPQVTIRRCEPDGRLEVESPFVSAGEAVGSGRMRARMGDRIDPASGSGFLLLGRADRTVKIAEKRLSLPEMERLLCEHDHVAEAALLVLEVAGRQRVHAVVVPTEGGRACCEAEGRRGFGVGLAEHLGRHFDPVMLPRAWRVVDALPRDSQDKLPAKSLAALFADRTGMERPRLPRVVSQQRSVDAIQRRIEIPDDLAQLEGHFDAFPVVAGVVQLAWALDAATDWLGHRPVLAGLEALKFPVPLRPGRSLTLRVERSAHSPNLRFRLHDGDVVFAVGRALLAEPESKLERVGGRA